MALVIPFNETNDTSILIQFHLVLPTQTIQTKNYKMRQLNWNHKIQ